MEEDVNNSQLEYIPNPDAGKGKGRGEGNKNLKYRITPEIHNEILYLRGSGYGLRKIRDSILQKFGVYISHMGIADYLESVDGKVSSYVQANEDAKKQVEQLFLDTKEQMKKLNEKLWTLLGELESMPTRDSRDIVMIASEIRRHVELQNKLLGSMYSGPSTVNVKTENLNIVDLSIKINKQLNMLEEKGYIKILKPLEEAVVL